MVKLLVISIILLFLALGGYLLRLNQQSSAPVGNNNAIVNHEKPLDRYAFERLKNSVFTASNIEIGRVVKEEPDFESSMFYFNVDGKRVSGLINVPERPGNYPVIVMFRGYVDKEKYTTGVGTARMGEFLAKNGFISLAPDFLGYGESDNPSESPIEERFQTYTTALTLLKSLQNLNTALREDKEGVLADLSKMGIWGHSNGGQIAFSVLEISGATYPTVLWAPVSKPFPYSILYYTDDFDDHGKMLRRVVADFEKDYDSEKYSFTNFFDFIRAPIQIHQGNQDEAVPANWSDQLSDSLEKLNKEVTYFTYPVEDHNFSQGSWPVVANRSLEFYRSNFSN